MEVSCYCGKGFKAKNVKLLLLDSPQFCCVECLDKFIQDSLKDDIVECSVGQTDFVPMDGRDVWDFVTRRFYRSRYEVNFARYLYYNEYLHQYEPKFVQVTKTKRYCPDFWLSQVHMFFEVKGLWSMGAKGKTAKAIAAGHPIIVVPDHLRAEFAKRYETKLDKVSR